MFFNYYNLRNKTKHKNNVSEKVVILYAEPKLWQAVTSRSQALHSSPTRKKPGHNIGWKVFCINVAL